MILRRATSLRGALEGMGSENRDFFGPWNGNERSECHLGPKKSTSRMFQREVNRSEANLVDERAELGDGVLPVADNLQGGLLLPGELAHARLLQLQLLAQLQLNLPFKRRRREIFKPKSSGYFCLPISYNPKVELLQKMASDRHQFRVKAFAKP